MNRFLGRAKVNPAFKIAQALPTLVFINSPEARLRSAEIDLLCATDFGSEKRLEIPVRTAVQVPAAQLARASGAGSPR